MDFDDRGPVIDNPVGIAEALEGLACRAVEADEPVAQTIRLVRSRVGETMPILGFIGAPWTLATYWVEGRMNKHYATVGALRFSDPSLLHDLMDRITGVVIDYLKIQIEAGADAVQVFDTWGSMLSQSEYSEFSAPYIQRIVDAIKPMGTPIILYLNGIAPYLDQLTGYAA